MTSRHVGYPRLITNTEHRPLLHSFRPKSLIRSGQPAHAKLDDMTQPWLPCISVAVKPCFRGAANNLPCVRCLLFYTLDFGVPGFLMQHIRRLFFFLGGGECYFLGPQSAVHMLRGNLFDGNPGVSGWAGLGLACIPLGRPLFPFPVSCTAKDCIMIVGFWFIFSVSVKIVYWEEKT